MWISAVWFLAGLLVGGLSVGLYLRYRRRQVVDEALSKTAVASRQVQSFVCRVGSDTENAIDNFAQLLNHLNKSIKATTGVVDEIKSRMALVAGQDGREESMRDQGLGIIQVRYEAMLGEVMEQLNLTVQRKSEDISRLDHIRNAIHLMKPFSQEISTIALSTKIIALNAAIEAARAGKSGECFAVVAEEVRRLADKATTSASSVEEELNSLIGYSEKAIDDLKSAMDVETLFINSTITLLQDVVLSVVDSFVNLSEVIQKTLGDSSRFRDDVNDIVVNLQFEDICHQVSQNTVKLIESIQDDLKRIHAGEDGIHGDGLHVQQGVRQKVFAKVSKLFTVAEELKNAREVLKIEKKSSDTAATSSKDEGDDVVFFDEAPAPSQPEKPHMPGIQEIPTSSGEDDVVFFDESPVKASVREDEVVFFEDTQTSSPHAQEEDDGVTFFDETPDPPQPTSEDDPESKGTKKY